MKLALLWMYVFLTLSQVLSAQAEPAQPKVTHDSTERMFFPRDTFWGYGQFDLAPPHNEIDPNICRADAGISGGVNDPCNAFARYMISGYIEAHPPLWPLTIPQVLPLRRAPLPGSEDLPETLYTWSMAAIGLEN